MTYSPISLPPHLSRYLDPTRAFIPKVATTVLHLADTFDDRHCIKLPKQRAKFLAGLSEGMGCDYWGVVSLTSMQRQNLSDVPWKLLPIISDPYYMEPPEKLNVGIYGQDSSNPEIFYDLKTAVAQADHILLHFDINDHMALAEKISKALAVIDAMGSYDKVSIYRQGKIEKVSREVLKLRASRFALCRFEYSYAHNFRYIAGRALQALVPNDQASMLPLFMWELEHPHTLQYLYQLYNKGELTVVDETPDLSGHGLFRPLDYDTERNVQWLVSNHQGKFPKARISSTHALSRMHALCNVGLITKISGDPTVSDWSDKYEVSSFGVRFLNSIHAKNYDPDLMDRWYHRELGYYDGSAMDVWIEKFFKRMIRKVNALIV